jgi:SAM-dependent methyltransferase
MPANPNDKAFAGSIPQLYERLLVPLLFEPYAADLERRITGRAGKQLLELAAGTGVVTRRLAAALPATTAITATDLNQPMIDQAAAVGTARPVQWRQADAMKLPFADASFDCVVCQFGVMFLPDKPAALAEARRVLRPGGLLVFNVWDEIARNEVAEAVTAALAVVFAQDPPRFLPRTPYGYHDRDAIARDVVAGGFASRATIDTVPQRSRARSARDAAAAFCQGTPLRGEIEARGATRLEEATDAAAAEVARRWGNGAIYAGMQAHVVSVVR